MSFFIATLMLKRHQTHMEDPVIHVCSQTLVVMWCGTVGSVELSSALTPRWHSHWLLALTAAPQSQRAPMPTQTEAEQRHNCVDEPGSNASSTTAPLNVSTLQIRRSHNFMASLPKQQERLKLTGSDGEMVSPHTFIMLF